MSDIMMTCGTCKNFTGETCIIRNNQTVKRGQHCANWEEGFHAARRGELEKRANLQKQEKPAKDHNIAADELMSVHKFITNIDTDEIFVYHEGIYIPAEPLIRFECHGLLGANTGKRFITETIDSIKRQTFNSLDDLTPDKELFCLKNGILNISTKEVSPYTPDLVFFSKLPLTYDPELDCLKIKKFISELVAEEDVKIIQEFIGYCLLRQYPIHKSFMLVGEGANGKSTFLNLLKTFIGQGNCSSIALQKLETSNFSIGGFEGKMVNIFADLPSKALSGTTYFKMLTGEDLIEADRKFKEPIKFVNYAKLIFSANTIPQIKEDTTAIWRRWVIINFPNTFSGDNEEINYLSELITDQEMSGCLNWALEGLARVLKHSKFSNSKTTEDTRDEYIRKSDSVAAFIMDCVIVSYDGFIPKKLCYSKYIEYCQKLNYPISSEQKFFKEIPLKVRVSEERRGSIGQRERGFVGIMFNEDDENTQTKL